MRRIFLSQVGRDLGHRHVLKGHDRLERFRLARLLAAERADEYRGWLFQPAESVEMGVEIIGREVDCAFVAVLTAERSADIDCEYQSGASNPWAAASCFGAPECGESKHSHESGARHDFHHAKFAHDAILGIGSIGVCMPRFSRFCCFFSCFS